jgi:hypothetical protein
MVEAIVVAITLAVLFMGLIFAHRFYSLRLRSLSTARSAGAALALYGCDRGMTASDVLSSADLQGVSVGSPDVAEITAAKPGQESGDSEARATLEKASASTLPLVPKVVKLRSQGAVSVSRGGDSALRGDVKSTTYLLCNDEPKAGSIKDIFPLIGDYL